MKLTPPRKRKLESIRSELCAPLRIAEELVPVHVLQTFYVVHEDHAKRALRYAQATVVRDAVPAAVGEAYRVAWGGEVILSKLVYGSGALGFLGRGGGLGFWFLVCEVRHDFVFAGLSMNIWGGEACVFPVWWLLSRGDRGH